MRVARTAFALLLTVLVVYLGAAAKHSQFADSLQQHGYLAKAVKMAGARLDSDTRVNPVDSLHTPGLPPPATIPWQPVFRMAHLTRATSVSVLARPLRV
ncbi:MAG TPA: hypothetical protein VGL72_19835 [Bryobacteraceae bacterium]|jgi:hypothetical protein